MTFNPIEKLFENLKQIKSNENEIHHMKLCHNILK